MNSILKLIARVFFAVLFILSGVSKLLDPNPVEHYMALKGLSYVQPLLYIAAIVEIVGGLFLLLGFIPRITALVLFGYLAIVTCTMHSFWTVAEPEYTTQMVEFLKNLGIMGGLLYVMATGAGFWAVTREKSSKK